MDPILAGLVGAIIGSVGGFLGSFVGARVAAGSQERIAQQQIESQLRLAAIDKRLQVHQEAYAYWIKIIRAMGDRETLGDLLKQAYEWWDNNCLYFSSPDLATDFRRTITEAGGYETMRRGGASATLLEDIYKQLMATGEKIQSAVGLPAIGNVQLQAKEKK